MKLPRISGKEAVKAFTKAGWIVSRQKGSHVILEKPGVRYTLSVPQHAELDRGLLRHMVRVAGMSVDEFRDLL